MCFSFAFSMALKDKTKQKEFMIKITTFVKSSIDRETIQELVIMFLLFYSLTW